MAELPWSDCKVAYGIEDPEAIWDGVGNGAIPLPHGWSLNETDSSGARHVAVFRVEGRLLVSDGQAVLNAIVAHEAKAAA